MRKRYCSGALLTISLFLILLAGCSEPPPDMQTPEGAALVLLEIAAETPLPLERIEALFGPAIGAEPSADLLDALAGMAGCTEPEIVASQPLEAIAQVAVDLTARLAGGGLAEISVQLQTTEQGPYQVIWFSGPGIEWPPPGRKRDGGISSSAPPEH
jgi:hypothetical protein